MYKEISSMLTVELVLVLFCIAAPAMAQPPVLNYVPGVCGMDLYSAEALLASFDFTVGTISWVFSDTVPYWIVIEQEPRELDMVPAGTAVDLTVSLGEGVVVPDVVGMWYYPDAMIALAIMGLDSDVSWALSDTFPRGMVMEQDPVGGEMVPPGSTVVLIISEGTPVIVPDVVGMTETAAMDALAAVGLYSGHVPTYQKHLCSDTIPEGHVMEQRPVAGQIAGLGSSVFLTISAGPCEPGTVTVPDVVGMWEVFAERELNIRDLTVGMISHEYSDIFAPGQVIEQDPVGGDMVPAGSAVNLTISLGPSGAEMVTVPDVLGMPHDEAESKLVAVGLSVFSAWIEYSDTIREGHVISQDPVGGDAVPHGTLVALSVSLGPGVEVPDVVGMTEAGAMDELALVGLDAEFAGYEHSDIVAEGHVSDQCPDSGEVVAVGSTVTLIISLGPSGGPNHPPEANDDAYTVNQYDTLSVAAPGVLGNDYDPDPDDTLTSELLSGPANGTLSLNSDGSLTYMPHADFLGTDTFVYMAIDYWGASCTAMVTITVAGIVVEVPDVVGMSQTDAASAIAAAGLMVGAISRNYSDTVSEGQVISQDPESGALVAEHSAVDVVISLGPAGPLVAGLVAHWKLDEIQGVIAYDSSISGNDGILYGYPIWQPTAGKINGALNFDGVDDYVETGKTASALGIGGNAPRTISAWVYTNSFNEGGIFEVGGQSLGQDFSLRTTPWDNRWRVQIWGGIVYDIDFTYDSKNKWVHFAHVYDGAHTKIYADGQLVVNEARTLNTTETKTFNIGRWAINYFDGLIDEVRIYNSALTENEIRSLAGGMVAHWKLDEIEGVIACDSSGNGNDGILYGGPIWQPTAGKINGTLDFDGVDDYVETGKTASALGIGGNAPRTISAWVYTNSFNEGGIFEVGGQSVGQDFSLRTTPWDNCWRVQIWGGIGYDIDFTYDSKNKWVHFAHVYDGAHTKIYANGQLVVDEARTLNTAETKTFNIGRWAINYFDGLIDDVRIYNRAVVTFSEDRETMFME